MASGQWTELLVRAVPAACFEVRANFAVTSVPWAPSRRTRSRYELRSVPEHMVRCGGCSRCSWGWPRRARQVCAREGVESLNARDPRPLRLLRRTGGPENTRELRAPGTWHLPPQAGVPAKTTEVALPLPVTVCNMHKQNWSPIPSSYVHAHMYTDTESGSAARYSCHLDSLRCINTYSQEATALVSSLSRSFSCLLSSCPYGAPHPASSLYALTPLLSPSTASHAA
ncbi:hypothetical protein C8Q70DRAFT_370934 [Cubamyces menziesii]|nr:hypothetical protein C8Q70DRAFT_370934 [Cubamyces menziesii]